MQLSHTQPVASAVFDDPNLVSCAGLIPMAALARKCGLAELADEHMSVPT
ncbi:MAG: IS1380 family transposase, partial [Mycobacterium sp.]